MRILLQPGLFAPPIDDLALIELFGHAADGRHRLEIDDEHPDVARWLGAQGPGLREQIAVALEFSVEAEAREPARRVIEVDHTGTSDWRRWPLRLTLADARRFLKAPFNVLLEHDRSDRAFLLALLTDDERRWFTSFEEHRWVEVRKGGGIEDMKAMVASAAATPEAPHAWWVLFDSDALRPGQPSAPSEKLKQACASIPHYQLARRFAESYLTLPALHGWASGIPKRTERERRLAVFRAFERLSPSQRHHYNMKEGFAGDQRRTGETSGDLYSTVKNEDRRVLDQGFDKQIASLFAGGSVMEVDLRREGAWDELRPALRELLELLR